MPLALAARALMSFMAPIGHQICFLTSVLLPLYEISFLFSTIEAEQADLLISGILVFCN